MIRHIAIIALLACALPVQASLRIFACEPEWGALARELALPDADLYVATTAQQDPHYIQARPSLLAQIRRADLLVCNGADLEIGWLPQLLQRAGNPGVQPGQPGHFLAAEGMSLLEVPVRVSRLDGDVHPQGNPHIHLDPQRILQAAGALTMRLGQLDAVNAAQYRERLTSFQARWTAAVENWQQRAATLRDLPVVVIHSEWRYLQEWTGIRVVAMLEPKPGVPASSTHLANVLTAIEHEKPLAVLTPPMRGTRGLTWLQKKTGIPVLEMPYTVGGSPEVTDLFSLFEVTLGRLESLRQ